MHEFLESETLDSWELYHDNPKSKLKCYSRDVGAGTLAIKAVFEVETTAENMFRFMCLPDAMQIIPMKDQCKFML
jgi:hypothetical protein